MDVKGVELRKSCLMLVLLSGVSGLSNIFASTTSTDKQASERTMELFSTTPAVFIENTGQIDEPSVKYVFYGNGANIFHTINGLVFELFKDEVDVGIASSSADRHLGPHNDEEVGTGIVRRSYGVAVRFVGARRVEPAGADLQETKVSYYIGNDPNKWSVGVPTYGKVVYPNLYDGIDLHTFGKINHLKYEFHVAPVTDYSQIVIKYEGIEGLSIDGDGRLVVQTPSGELVDDKPVIWQVIEGKEVEISGRYRLIDKTSYTFEITGKIDPSCELIIDPELVWSSFLGGSSEDYGEAIAVDSSGDVFLTGRTFSTDFPVLGGFDTSSNGVGDVFVAKVTNDGVLSWASYLGGSDEEVGYGAAVDSSGDVFLTGQTYSTDFPVPGGFDTSFGGGYDAFVAKVTNAGELSWASYLGGSGAEVGWGVAVDLSGDVFLAGRTGSVDFPVPGGFDESLGGLHDAFVAKVTNAGALSWASYLGGSSEEGGCGVAVDLSGNVFLTGWTMSVDFPVPGGFDVSLDGSNNAFVAKVTNAGALSWASYLGEGSSEWGRAIAVGLSGDVFVMGCHICQCMNVFIAKVTNAGALSWRSYLGVHGGKAIAADSSGNVFLTGYTSSGDAFVVKVTNAGALSWASYLGGYEWDEGSGVAIDSSGDVFLTGWTKSTDFPVPGGFDTTHNGFSDVFVAKICMPVGGLDVDCDVDFDDYAVFGRAWLTEPNDPNWNAAADISVPANNSIDIWDLATLAAHWLEGTE